MFSLKHVLSFCLLLQVTTNNLIKFYSKVKRGLRTIVIFNEKVLKNEQVKSVKLFEKKKQRSKSLLFDEKEKGIINGQVQEQPLTFQERFEVDNQMYLQKRTGIVKKKKEKQEIER